MGTPVTYSCNKYYYYYYLVVGDEQLRIWEHPSPTAAIHIIIIIIQLWRITAQNMGTPLTYNKMYIYYIYPEECIP